MYLFIIAVHDNKSSCLEYYIKCIPVSSKVLRQKVIVRKNQAAHFNKHVTALCLIRFSIVQEAITDIREMYEV